MLNGYAIETDQLTRKFGEIVAVNNVSLRIKYGEIFGLLGPNGAGKTTLTHMLCTILRPTSGTARVVGHDVCSEPDEVRSSIGIVFQEPSLDSNLTGRENLDFHGRMYGMSSEQRKERIEEVLSLVGLTNRADSLVRTYSGGMKRRLEIARGLMHHPKILFLDEPTLGLDAQTRRVVWEQIEKLNQTEKITIVLTTHYIEEADYLCDRVAIIDLGRIVALDTPQALKDKLEGDVVYLKVDNLKKFLPIFQKCRLTKGVKVTGDYLQLQVGNGSKTIPKIIEMVRKRGGQVQEVSLKRPSLEDVFINYTGRAIREEGPDAASRFGMHGHWRR
ncbi:ATP-binding cassette domain-containing protein [Candidatus Bipolaricaulota bacterium]|nr:ATP-binding cassette domain-containing protein [Candidatus Bipolaricaulota bacterium]